MNEMRNITAGDITGINRQMDQAKPQDAKTSGEAKGFGDEVRKFSESRETQKKSGAQARREAYQHKALGQKEHKTHRNAESERLSEEKSLVNTRANNTLRAENGEVEERSSDEALAERNEYALAAVNSENGAQVQFGGAGSDAVTSNIQAFSSDFYISESFKAVRDKAIENISIGQPQTQALPPEVVEAINGEVDDSEVLIQILPPEAVQAINDADNTESLTQMLLSSNDVEAVDGADDTELLAQTLPAGGVEDVNSVDDTELAQAPPSDEGEAVNSVDNSESFRKQAQEILDKSDLWVFETTLPDGSVCRVISNAGKLKPDAYAEKQPESLSKAPWAVENIAKMLETMALNGESLEDIETDGLGMAAALIRKYSLLEKSQTEQVQNPVAGSEKTAAEPIQNPSAGTIVSTGANEKLTGYIPQATDPAQLTSGSEIKWTADSELTPAVEQKSADTAAYSGDQGKIVSQQNTIAADFTPVDSQALRAMYKNAGQENQITNAPEKQMANEPSVSVVVNTSNNTQKKAESAASDGVRIPVSYTELSSASANVKADLPDVQAGLTAEPAEAPEQSAQITLNSAQTVSQPSDVSLTNAGVASTDSEAAASLSPGMGETAADIDGGDSHEPLQTEIQANAAKAVEAAEKATASLSRVDQQAIIDQITERLQTAIRRGVHEMRVTLRPQELGEVRMSIKVEGDQVTARMVVESEQVKAIVEKHFQQLKDSLEQQNLHAAKLSVDVGNGSERQQMWREMASGANAKGFKQSGGGDGDSGASELNGNFAGASGGDTGRRFGNNTFEFFV